MLFGRVLREAFNGSNGDTSGRVVVRESDEVSPLKDGPDHACDALRYMIVNMDWPMRAGVRDY